MSQLGANKSGNESIEKRKQNSSQTKAACVILSAWSFVYLSCSFFYKNQIRMALSKKRKFSEDDLTISDNVGLDWKQLFNSGKSEMLALHKRPVASETLKNFREIYLCTSTSFRENILCTYSKVADCLAWFFLSQGLPNKCDYLVFSLFLLFLFLMTSYIILTGFFFQKIICDCHWWKSCYYVFKNLI